jgi:hypothetical protein
LRNPRDGERFVILLDPINEDRKIETEAKIKKFVAETMWRRLKSRYKIERVQTEEPPEVQRAEFESVEEGMRGKPTRYRQRFKQKKQIWRSRRS